MASNAAKRGLLVARAAFEALAADDSLTSY